MRPPTHRIRRQVWRVRASSPAEALALRQRLREELTQTLQPVFERVFDEIAPGSEVIRLPRLEIHARVASLDELIEALPDLLRRAVHDRLGEPSAPGEGR